MKHVTQREVDLRFEAANTAILIRSQAAEKAIDLASEAMNLRLERMNEFREQLQQERGEYIKQSDLSPIMQRLDTLEKLSNIAKGRDLGLLGIALLAVGSLIAFAGNILIKVLGG